MYKPILGKKLKHKRKIMASGGLLVFPTFSLHADPNTTSIRWKKWIDKLKILFVALDTDNDKKRKATLLHYTGDEVFDIYQFHRSAERNWHHHYKRGWFNNT